MTNLSTRNLAVAAAAVCLLAASDATAYTLRIQARGGQGDLGEDLLPIASVRITFETAGLPTGTVTVDDAEVQVSSDAFDIATTGAGDRIMAKRDGTSALLLIQTLGWFEDYGTDKCNTKPGSSEKTLSVTVSGFSPVGYRLSSYSATSRSNCRCATRRVRTQAAEFVGDGTPGSSRGRHPLDLVFVLDRSGSMGSRSGNKTKWEILQESFAQVADFWAIEGLGEGADLSDDHLGLVLFSTTPLPGTGDAVTLEARGDSTAPWSARKSEVAGQSPGGTTTVGGGLQVALDALSRQDNDKTIILMTDGMQNTRPLIVENNVKLSLNGTELANQCVPILPVGVGQENVVDASFLDRMAEETAGLPGRIIDTEGMATAFEESLVKALKGSTRSIALQTRAAGNKTYTFDVDRTVRSVVITLGWHGFLAYDAVLRDPGGKMVYATHRLGGAQHKVQRFDFPDSGPTGTYRVDIAPIQFGARQASVPEEFHLGVYLEERELDYRLSVDKERYGTGDPIVMTAFVGLGGEPIDADGVSVTAHVEHPKAALGDRLSDLPMGTVPPDLDADLASSPYDRKLASLKDSEEFQSLVGSVLEEQPRAVGRVENGVFQLRYLETRTPGIYRFNVTVEIGDGEGAPIRRTEAIEAAVEARPDREKTEITRAWEPDSAAHILTFEPRDKFGTRIGPGFESWFKVEVDNNEANVETSNPDADGKYKISFTGLGQNDNPRVRIGMAGSPFADEKLQKDGGCACGGCNAAGPGSSGLLLALLWLGRRRRRLSRHR